MDAVVIDKWCHALADSFTFIGDNTNDDEIEARSGRNALANLNGNTNNVDTKYTKCVIIGLIDKYNVGVTLPNGQSQNHVPTS